MMMMMKVNEIVGLEIELAYYVSENHVSLKTSGNLNPRKFGNTNERIKSYSVFLYVICNKHLFNNL